MLCVLAFLFAMVPRHKTVVDNCAAAWFFSGGWNSNWAAALNLQIESCRGSALFWWKLTSSQANRVLQTCSSIIFNFSNVCLEFPNTKIPCKITTLTKMRNKWATKSIMHPSYSLVSNIWMKSPKSVYKSKLIMLKSTNSKTLTHPQT